MICIQNSIFLYYYTDEFPDFRPVVAIHVYDGKDVSVGSGLLINSNE
jgi:hypothetical protein